MLTVDQRLTRCIIKLRNAKLALQNNQHRLYKGIPSNESEEAKALRLIEEVTTELLDCGMELISDD